MTKWLIIDGYNLLHRIGKHWSGDPTFRARQPFSTRPGNSVREFGLPGDLTGKRRRLIQLLEKTVGVLAERITVVFDGRSGDGGHSGDGPARSATDSVAGGPHEQESPVVEVLFSPGNKTADTVIEQLVFQAGAAGGVVVVTSDRLERETAGGAGAETMACSVFLDQLNETLVRIEQELRSRSASQHPATPLGNPFSSLAINNPAAPSGA